MDVKIGVYETNNQPKKATFKYEQEGRVCLVVAKVEFKEYGTITGKHFLLFDYTGNNYSLSRHFNPSYLVSNVDELNILANSIGKQTWHHVHH